MLAKDCSNYSVNPLPLEQWKAAGIGLVLAQMFPPSYRQYIQQGQQMRQCADAGMPFDLYCYDYVADPSWRDQAILGMTSLASAGLVARRLWADEEDVSGGSKAMSPARRVTAVRATLQALDLAPSRLGLTGVYTGGWWWKPSTANYQGFADRPLWDAHYDGIADASGDYLPYGGWSFASIKQFAGSQSDGTDLDVLSATEVGQLITPEGTNVAIVVGQGMQAQMAAAGDAPLFGHKFYTEVDDQGKTYSVEECYGSKGRYASSNSSGGWVNAGPYA